MSEFNIDDYEKVEAMGLLCTGCVAEFNSELCTVIPSCFTEGDKPMVFKLKDKSKGESDD